MKSRTIGVCVPADTYEKAKDYSDKTGVPITRIIREALEQWLTTTGAARLEALKGIKQ